MNIAHLAKAVALTAIISAVMAHVWNTGSAKPGEATLLATGGGILALGLYALISVIRWRK
mgnify:CR=1 FL=1